MGVAIPDWELRGERQNLVLGGYDDWYLDLPLGQLPDWLRWLTNDYAGIEKLDDVEITMTCTPDVIRDPAPPPPGQ